MVTAPRPGLGPSLEGELAMVTGGARRIGRAIATALAQAGADVVVHYHSSSEAAEATAAALQDAGVEAWTAPADLTDPAAAETLLDQATQIAGRPPGLLVNSASAFPQATLAEVDPRTLAEALEINAWAPLALTRALAEAVDEGAVVNLLDARINRADRSRVAYAVSKDALASLTRISALELAPSIRVNAVAPGPILPPSRGPTDALEAIARATPIGRAGQPSEVAQAVVHLLGARYTTGAILPVDGGQHLTAGVHHG